MGTETGTPIVAKNADGSSDYVRNSAGEMVMSKMRPGFLSDLAKETGGQMIPPSARGQIESMLRSLKPSKKATTIRVAEEWFWVPLALAFLTAAAGLCINTRKGLTIKNGARNLAKSVVSSELGTTAE